MDRVAPGRGQDRRERGRGARRRQLSTRCSQATRGPRLPARVLKGRTTMVPDEFDVGERRPRGYRSSLIRSRIALTLRHTRGGREKEKEERKGAKKPGAQREFPLSWFFFFASLHHCAFAFDSPIHSHSLA